MLEKDFMEKAISRIENKYKYENEIDLNGRYILNSFGMESDDENYEEALSFCDDYINLYKNKKNSLSSVYKFKDNDYIDAGRIVLNSAIYGGLASIIASDPMFSAGAAGFGLGMTSYDEIKDHSSINMGNAGFYGVIGSLIGSLFTDSETGRYIGAGVGAFYSAFKQIYNNKKYEDYISNISKEEALENVYSKYDKKKENLIDMYS